MNSLNVYIGIGVPSTDRPTCRFRHQAPLRGLQEDPTTWSFFFRDEAGLALFTLHRDPPKCWYLAPYG